MNKDDLIVKLYNEGKSNAEIAASLNVSIKTIEKRLSYLRALKKIGFREKNTKNQRYKHQEILQEVRQYIDDAKQALEEAKNLYNINIKCKLSGFTGKQTEDQVLLWSDMHFGMVNKNPITGKITYDENTVKNIEFPALLKGMHRFWQLYKPTYKIERLYILDLGDNITNDRIYEGQQKEITCGVGRQILQVLEYQSIFILKMLELFPEIIFIGVPGNHGRTTSNPISEDATDNFEYLKNCLLKERFMNNKRVKIIVPDTYLYTLEIRKHKYLLLHGNTIKGTTLNSIEKATSQLADLAKSELYDAILIGHLHTSLKLKIKPTTDLLVNGCWVDMDSYAYNVLRKYSSATQWHFLVSNKSHIHNLQEINLTWR